MSRMWREADVDPELHPEVGPELWTESENIPQNTTNTPDHDTSTCIHWSERLESQSCGSKE